MRKKNSTLTETRERVYTRTVTKRGRQFRMDDETYEKLTRLARLYGMRRAAILRMFINEKFASHRMSGDF